VGQRNNKASFNHQKRLPHTKKVDKINTMIKAILFDLDGTLAQVPNDIFEKFLFSGYTNIAVKNGFEPKSFVGAVMRGYHAMVENQTDETNKEAFWQVFTKLVPNQDYQKLEKVFHDFYTTDFDELKHSLTLKIDLGDAFRKLRQRGLKLVLATNPMFPLAAVATRLAWVGLTLEHFDFITVYDNSTRSKKTVEYYSEILGKIGTQPNETIMVGNHVEEDMIAAKLGCQVFLVTDHLLNPNNTDISAYPNGSLINFLKIWQ
jgi:FMN phosphatase YigB (HAD superfamily)